ncbi:MAK10-like protein [Tanacetum coccineum]
MPKIGDENPIRTLGDYSKPSHEGYRSTIELLAGNNVVPLRSETIWLMHNGCSFHGLWSKDPNQHLKDFIKLVDSLDLDDENRERTRLRLFQFSLRDQARNWLECLPAGSISTWEDLTTRFLAQFFPPGRTAKLRYDILIWNDPRDFTKAVKAIALPQDVPSTSDRRLIELKNQVQRLMEAHLAPTQPTQVNKITTSCEIYSGPHDTQYCMEDPEQAFVEYASSRTDEAGGTQLEQQQDDMNGKINLLWKTISEKLNNVSTLKNAGNPMAPKNIAAISHDEREELRKKGIKSPSKLLSLKYLSPASIKELNKNPSAPKRVHFVNSIVIPSTDSDTKEYDSSTNERDLNLDGVIKRKEGVKDQDKKENEIETDMEVDGEIEA